MGKHTVECSNSSIMIIPHQMPVHLISCQQAGVALRTPREAVEYVRDSGVACGPVLGTAFNTFFHSGAFRDETDMLASGGEFDRSEA